MWSSRNGNFEVKCAITVYRVFHKSVRIISLCWIRKSPFRITLQRIGAVCIFYAKLHALRSICSITNRSIEIIFCGHSIKKSQICLHFTVFYSCEAFLMPQLAKAHQDLIIAIQHFLHASNPTCWEERAITSSAFDHVMNELIFFLKNHGEALWWNRRRIFFSRVQTWLP